jgi:predicted Zn-dependent protease with MMP-like domain/predicted Zn-dependent protease
MDRISAHLDRGWDLLLKGDARGARRSAKKVLDLDPDSPDALTLLGAIANADGHPEQAIELFERAADLDEGYIDPLLHAAETYLYPLEDHARALGLAERALAIAEDDHEKADALLLKADVLLGRDAEGDEEEARLVLADVPDDLEDAELHLRAGQLCLDVGDLRTAERHLRAALDREPRLADAWHALGMLHEERGETRQMIKAWTQVRDLDLREARPAWGIGRPEFERLIGQGFDELPERIRALLANVPLIAADYPEADLVAEGTDPRLLGFFSGVPYPEKSNVGGVPHLDCIFLYQRNIERLARTRETVIDEVATTLRHETGHFFGLSEEELEEMGLG